MERDKTYKLKGVTKKLTASQSPKRTNRRPISDTKSSSRKKITGRKAKGKKISPWIVAGIVALFGIFFVFPYLFNENNSETGDIVPEGAYQFCLDISHHNSSDIVWDSLAVVIDQDRRTRRNIEDGKEIKKISTVIIKATEGTRMKDKKFDEFWEKAEKLLYSALIGYIHYEAPEEEQNFSTLLEMINAMEVREDDEEFKNPVDLMFDELAERDPDHFAVRQYAKYKLSAGKTAKSILVSCGARLAPFDIKELREITAYDELQLDTLGDKKTALFLIMSDTDATFNFLISMVYTQLFNLLCEKADDVYGGRLPVHVRCLIDEAANIGQIPNLEKLMATIRSREISAALVLQAKSQLKAIYKDNADTIIGNCDSQIFLGGSEQTTLKDLNTTLGKETIDMYNTGETRGTSQSYNMNYQKLGHDLMSIDELAVMDGGKCIVQVRGVRPFLSSKYDLTQHPNYLLTADADKRNLFDIEKFLNHNLILKPDDKYEVIEITEE